MFPSWITFWLDWLVASFVVLWAGTEIFAAGKLEGMLAF
jgi:hypothetical protein